ncbi:hypothetical protein [Actinacidiphila sp. ITFR-21]|uniref:hypothetical protein n=1 Tax=Actinacidiphila sp. ITFR-21 TaxID=3075199 RepID=UPI00288B84FD|nr:hypothetical protein [Streptomyces sp. ITFR-21]WNI16648.1 hypothetical protein RLT57_14750 [Streptomyces sp. ITFR-21]
MTGELTAAERAALPVARAGMLRLPAAPAPDPRVAEVRERFARSTAAYTAAPFPGKIVALLVEEIERLETTPLPIPGQVFLPLRDGLPIDHPYATRDGAAARCEAEARARAGAPGLALEWLPGLDDPAVTELAQVHRAHTSATGYAVRTVPVLTTTTTVPAPAGAAEGMN